MFQSCAAGQRQIWAGMSHRNSAEEIVRQIRLERQQSGASGHVHWSMKSLLQNTKGTADALVRETYAEPALAPAWPWLDATPPPVPKLAVTADARGALQAAWTPAAGENAWLWLLQTRAGGVWKTEVLPASQTTRALGTVEAISLTAVDRCGNTSAPVVMSKPVPQESKRGR